MATILYCFCKFYNSSWIIEKFKSWKFTKLRMLSTFFFLKSINRTINQINYWQFENSVFQIALVIFKYLSQLTELLNCDQLSEFKYQNIIYFEPIRNGKIRLKFLLQPSYVGNCNICAKQKISLRNKRNLYKLWTRLKRWVQKTAKFC